MADNDCEIQFNLMIETYFIPKNDHSHSMNKILINTCIYNRIQIFVVAEYIEKKQKNM